MLMFPECQKAAREEIDRVVGRDRLPEFSDRESMPYITAMAHEVLRCVDFLRFDKEED